MKIQLGKLSNNQLIKLGEDVEIEKKKRIKSLNDAINTIEDSKEAGK